MSEGMPFDKALALIEKYGHCLQCGQNAIRRGVDNMIINEDEFIRTCGCGWSVKTDADGNELEVNKEQ